jgi:MFS family permease
MGGRGGLEGWRWIIIIEGILTALVGVVAYFVLPETVDKAAFLSPEERHLAVQRIMADRPVEIDASGRMVVVNEQFKWKDVIAPLLSPMVSLPRLKEASLLIKTLDLAIRWGLFCYPYCPVLFLPLRAHYVSMVVGALHVGC